MGLDMGWSLRFVLGPWVLGSWLCIVLLPDLALQSKLVWAQGRNELWDMSSIQPCARCCSD